MTQYQRVVIRANLHKGTRGLTVQLYAGRQSTAKFLQTFRTYVQLLIAIGIASGSRRDAADCCNVGCNYSGRRPLAHHKANLAKSSVTGSVFNPDTTYEVPSLDGAPVGGAGRFGEEVGAVVKVLDDLGGVASLQTQGANPA